MRFIENATMKKILLNLFIIFLIPIFVAAQLPLSVSQSTVKYKGDEHPCIEVILQPEAKAVKKAWEDFLKDQYDVNLKGIGFLANKDVLSAEKVNFPELSDKEMDFYTKVVEKKGATRMSVFASLGYDIYIAPEGDYAKGFRTMEDIVGQFLAHYLPEYYQNTIEEIESQVSELQETYSDQETTLTENRRQIEDLEKQIKDLRKDNKDLEKELKNTSQTLRETRTKLEDRKSAFETVKTRLNLKDDASSN